MRNLINRYARIALSASAVLASLFMTGLLSGCMGYGEKEPDNPAPSISSLNATQAKQQTWQLSANVSNTDGVKSCGYYVGKDNSLKDAVLVNGSISGNSVVASYEAKEYGVSYYYKAFVSNGRTEVCSSVGSFKMSSIPVTSVELNSNELNLAPGGNAQLTATVLPSNATDKTLTWSSSNGSVATVSDNGLLTAVSNGSCIITATANNGVKAECQVTVKTVSYTDLSSSGTANCYIVSSQGSWKFKATVKGNSSESVGSPSKAEVLWETFGTSTTPSVGDVVSNVSYSGGYVTFTSGKDGNAVIAVKDASGNILWSWHIWVCEGYDPKATQQTYNNSAGIMMDRNLGATSASKGSVGALGLLYQWGRKDPFLGSLSISSNTVASSTISWPSSVASSSSTGTIAYAVSHPTTFITYNNSNDDWYYTGSSSTDNTRWQSSKTKYDPCPPGYRVPDGGSSGVWSVAFGTSSSWTTSSNWDSTNKGMNFGSTDRKLGSGVIWYPVAGFLYRGSGSLGNVGNLGYYWSCTPDGYYAYLLYFRLNGLVIPSDNCYRALGQSVRCLSESSTPIVPVTGVQLDKTSATLSPGGTLQLSGSVVPSNANVKTITWSSSDTGIATVSENGLVTAVANGSCTITATAYNGVKAECKLTVEKAAGNDLSASGTANCYIVSSKGNWKFKATVKGNSSESVGSPTKAEVLWETFGTSTKPNVGDVVSNVSYSGGYVSFTSGKDGNAVIAVKDASGNILWSWHIWVCEGYDPKATQQTYNNNAGVMMDRNLGATSASKGSVGALGLLYQWGRKDPFLGGCQISYSSYVDQQKASSTLSWPSAVSSAPSIGTIAYAVSHPTTFITSNSNNSDWYYSSSSSTDNTRWQSSKTKYDPCPPGYRVPGGGSSGVWSVAFGTSSGWTTSSNWDSTNRGMNFGSTDKKLGSGVIWYPAAGYLYCNGGSLYYVGYGGDYWSCPPNGSNAYYLGFGYGGGVNPSESGSRASGRSVRCMKE